MDLSIIVNGMTFPNPFLLGSGPPGTKGSLVRFNTFCPALSASAQNSSAKASLASDPARR